MEIRELKYYKWIFDKNKIILVDKRNEKSIILSLAMADSFSRACLSFKNKYRIEQVSKRQEMIKRVRGSYQKRIDVLKLKINKLKEEKNGKETNK